MTPYGGAIFGHWRRRRAKASSVLVKTRFESFAYPPRPPQSTIRFRYGDEQSNIERIGLGYVVVVTSAASRSAAFSV